MEKEKTPRSQRMERKEKTALNPTEVTHSKVTPDIFQSVIGESVIQRLPGLPRPLGKQTKLQSV